MSKSNVKPTADAILAELRKRANKAQEIEHVPKFKLEEFCFDKQLAFIKDPAKFKTAVCSRRCLAEGTLVQTTAGPLPIEQIRPGMFVYDEYGQPIEVINIYDNGIREVINVLHNRRTLFKATGDHVFPTYHSRIQGIKERRLDSIYGGVKLIRNEVIRENGIDIPYAYSIGALLGDGCGTEGGKSYIIISSENNLIPSKVAKELQASNLKKLHPNNHSYKISINQLPEEYKLWCHKRKAHEKQCNLMRILSWNRPSRLAFIAGLLDTDGSVSNRSDGIQITISMQAKPVIDVLKILFLDLWGYEPSISIDNREKYKNGPVYNLRLKHNYFGKKILNDLDPHIVTPRKKWKSSYNDKIENNYNSKYIGIKLGQKILMPTYDLRVNSATNLYMLANGIITHNSGKTVACAADLIATAIEFTDVNVLYITLNRKAAKRIIWKDLLKILKKYKINAKIDNTELSIEILDTGSTIYVSGASDASEIEKFRGMALKKVYIDESQSFRSYIEQLVEDIIEPALYDHDGSLCLIGTPGPVCTGFFYTACHNPEWANYKWTIFDNPHILRKSGKTPEQILSEVRRRRGITENNPTYRRESLGEWVQDSDALVYRFNRDKNRFTSPPSGPMDYIFGIDIGFNDADAIAVLGYSHLDKNVYLIEEWVKNKQNITQLVNKINELKKKYDPVKMVMDAGALGKKIQEEIKQRHSLYIEAADKTRKLEFIELLNDDLRTGRFLAYADSRFEQDSYLVQWDYSNPDKPKISDTYHTDIGDAVLYAWRECKHYYYSPPKPVTKVGTNEYMDELERKEAEKMEHDLTREWYEPSSQDLEDIELDIEDLYSDEY